MELTNVEKLIGAALIVLWSTLVTIYAFWSLIGGRIPFIKLVWYRARYDAWSKQLLYLTAAYMNSELETSEKLWREIQKAKVMCRFFKSRVDELEARNVHQG